MNVFLAALTDEMKGRKDEVMADIHNYKPGRQLKPASGVGTMAGICFERHFPLKNKDQPPTCTRPDLRASCQLTSANALKTGVMRNTSVIK